MNGSAIDECHVIFFAGEWAIKTLGWIIFTLETDKVCGLWLVTVVEQVHCAAVDVDGWCRSRVLGSVPG